METQELTFTPDMKKKVFSFALKHDFRSEAAREVIQAAIVEGITHIDQYLTPDSLQKLLQRFSLSEQNYVLQRRNRLMEKIALSVLNTWQVKSLEGEIDNIISIANRIASAEIEPIGFTSSMPIVPQLPDEWQRAYKEYQDSNK